MSTDYRTFLAKAARIATMCLQDKTKEQKLWKLACDYVLRAQDCKINWNRLTELEVKMLETGIPHPILISFFDAHVVLQNENSQLPPIPPAPSNWWDIKKLNDRIAELEEERALLPSPQEHERLKQTLASVTTLHQQHTERSGREQEQLQDELKQMRKAVKDHEDTADEAEYRGYQVAKITKRLQEYRERHRTEMDKMYVDLENAHFELENAQHDNKNLKEQVRLYQSKVEQVERHIVIYQEVCAEIVPTLNEHQSEMVNQIVGQL
jgi:DNA repair exonuclease SbcCD ATPase subunit